MEGRGFEESFLWSFSSKVRSFWQNSRSLNGPPMTNAPVHVHKGRPSLRREEGSQQEKFRQQKQSQAFSSTPLPRACAGRAKKRRQQTAAARGQERKQGLVRQLILNGRGPQLFFDQLATSSWQFVCPLDGVGYLESSNQSLLYQSCPLSLRSQGVIYLY